MAIPSFYHPTLDEGNSNVDLDPSEALHAVKARRLKAGQVVRLFNGHGLVGFGKLSQVDRRSASVVIESYSRATASSSRLSIAVAIPKGERQKVMIDMLTQLGVYEIIPLICEHSVTKAGANSREKWHRVVIESAKQSQNPVLPRIKEDVTVNDLLNQNKLPILFANADGKSLLQYREFHSELLVLIGPEGGFSEAEFENFSSRNMNAVSLGGHILRTEAAAIAVAAQFNLLV
jgi:16S rRNA (uracil1498-N3)-methyltransferase